MPDRPSTQHTDVVLLRVFAHLNAEGTEGRTAEAHLTLQSGDQITLRAGGPGIHSTPAAAPFTAYEVLSSSDTEPKFWRRYTDSVGVLYANVPAMLVTHFVHRSGGVTDYLLETSRREVTELVNLKLGATSSARQRIMDFLDAMEDAVVVTATYTPSTT